MNKTFPRASKFLPLQDWLAPPDPLALRVEAAQPAPPQVEAAPPAPILRCREKIGFAVGRRARRLGLESSEADILLERVDRARTQRDGKSMCVMLADLPDKFSSALDNKALRNKVVKYAGADLGEVPAVVGIIRPNAATDAALDVLADAVWRAHSADVEASRQSAADPALPLPGVHERIDQIVLSLCPRGNGGWAIDLDVGGAPMDALLDAHGVLDAVTGFAHACGFAGLAERLPRREAE